MSTILPDNESLKRAVKWISEHLKERDEYPSMTLINEAILKFDLNPKLSLYLINFYRKK
jgi:hypothetical protein